MGAAPVPAAVPEREQRRRYVVLPREGEGEEVPWVGHVVLHKPFDVTLGASRPARAGAGPIVAMAAVLGSAVVHAAERILGAGRQPDWLDRLRDTGRPRGPRVLDARSDCLLVEGSRRDVAALGERYVVEEDVPIFPAATRPAVLPRGRSRRVAGGRDAVRVKVVSTATGLVVPGALVTGKFGDDIVWRLSDRRGSARLRAAAPLGYVWVDSTAGHWAAARPVGRDEARGGVVTVKLMPVDDAHVDALRHRYGATDLDDGRGVRVAVIDTGVGPHSRLVVAGGRGYDARSQDGPPTAKGPWHGTHVAGIIASRAEPPRRGLAPGVTLLSYRPFAEDEDGSSYAASLAILEAVEEGCDILNLSFTSEPSTAIARRVERAAAEGVIVVAAAGNDRRGPTAFPARLDGVLAVGALGRRGTFPPGTAADNADAAAGPVGSDPDDFVAAFSNRLRDDDVIAPGVGTLSTMADNGFGSMDGTSMAAPVVTGLIARRLAQPPWRGQPRSPERAAAVLAQVAEDVDDLGFPADVQGLGAPRMGP